MDATKKVENQLRKAYGEMVKAKRLMEKLDDAGSIDFTNRDVKVLDSLCDVLSQLWLESDSE